MKTCFTLVYAIIAGVAPVVAATDPLTVNDEIKELFQAQDALAKDGTVIKQFTGSYDQSGGWKTWDLSFIDFKANEIISFRSMMIKGVWTYMGGFGYRDGNVVIRLGDSWVPWDKADNDEAKKFVSILRWASASGMAASYFRNADKVLANPDLAKDPVLLTDALDAKRSFDSTTILKEGKLRYARGGELTEARLDTDGLAIEATKKIDDRNVFYAFNERIPAFPFGKSSIAIVVDGQRIILPNVKEKYDIHKRKFGMSLMRIKGQFVIYAVAEGGPAEKAGIKAGSILRTINNHPVQELDESSLLTLLNPEKQQEMLIGYQGKDVKVTLAPVK